MGSIPIGHPTLLAQLLHVGARSICLPSRPRRAEQRRSRHGEDLMQRSRSTVSLVALGAAALVAACGGGGAAATPTAAPATQAPVSVAPATAAPATPTAQATSPSTGAPNIEA